MKGPSARSTVMRLMTLTSHLLCLPLTEPVPVAHHQSTLPTISALSSGLVDGTEVNVEVMRTKAHLYSHYEVAQLAWANDAEARTKGSCQGGTIHFGVTAVDKKANFQKHSASMSWGRFPTTRGLCILGETDKAAFDVDVHVRRWCTLMSTARTTATVGRLLRYVLRDVGD